MSDAKSPSQGRTLRQAAGRVTLREVARHLGVSVATVSNAYNRPDQLSEELRERILATAELLGYQGPDPLARSLRRGKTGVIGVVYDAPLAYAFADPAAALFLGGVARVLQREQLTVLLLPSPDDVQPVRSASVDGFIVYCASEGSELLSAVLERRLPTVLVDQQANASAARVGIDDFGGAQAAARHLADLGHRQIGVICLELGPERRGGLVSAEREAAIGYRTTAERLRAYRAGAATAQLYPMETEQNAPDEGERRTLELLEQHPEMTGLLCMSDVLAQGALRAATRLGRRVPQDLSVIGYDDLPSSTAVRLTTVWQPTEEKGHQAAEALLRLFAGDAPEEVILPTRLVIRESTAPPPQVVAARASADKQTKE